MPHKKMWLFVLSVLSIPAFAKDNRSFALDIKGTSLQQLMSIKITSLSKKQESLNRAAAAVFVITSDEIKRMGVTHIAEALRYVPGVEVARLEANKWSISIRGFNERAANKLLVLIDGRSLYSTLFSGVLWEEKDVMLEDVDRIEVVRGPGGTLWGSNAVNGIINIITKHAKDTQGGLVKVGVGKEEEGLAVARYGWQSSDAAFGRAYGKFVRRDDGGEGTIPKDAGAMNQVGFRHDWYASEAARLSIRGDLYREQIGHHFSGLDQPGQEDTGGNLMMNYIVGKDTGAENRVTGYFDKTLLELQGFRDWRETWNLEYQSLIKLDSNDFMWGVGYRTIRDTVSTYPFDYLQPVSKNYDVVNLFVQDEYAITNDWHLIAGTKVEHNDFSGVEWQPTVRTSYAMNQSVLWAALSRAIRTPTRLEKDISTPQFPEFGKYFDSEKVLFKELGWRYLPNDRWSFDLAIYRADYDKLLSREGNYIGNKLYGGSQGMETSTSWQVTPDWLLRVNYTHAQIDLNTRAGSLDQSRSKTIAGSSPRNTAQLSSLWDINAQWQLNGYVRFVDELRELNVSKYCVFDVSVLYHPNKNWEFEWVGRHLGDNEHPEWYLAPPGGTTEVESDLEMIVTRRFE